MNSKSIYEYRVFKDANNNICVYSTSPAAAMRDKNFTLNSAVQVNYFESTHKYQDMLINTYKDYKQRLSGNIKYS